MIETQISTRLRWKSQFVKPSRFIKQRLITSVRKSVVYWSKHSQRMCFVDGGWERPVVTGQSLFVLKKQYLGPVKNWCPFSKRWSSDQDSDRHNYSGNNLYFLKSGIVFGWISLRGNCSRDTLSICVITNSLWHNLCPWDPLKSFRRGQITKKLGYRLLDPLKLLRLPHTD